MTGDRLKEIEKRAAKATPGPWVETHDIDCGYYRSSSGLVSGKTKVLIYDPSSGEYASAISKRENIEFIGNSREDIPWLVTEVKRLTEERKAIISCLNCEGCAFVPCDEHAEELEEGIADMKGDSA